MSFLKKFNFFKWLNVVSNEQDLRDDLSRAFDEKVVENAALTHENKKLLAEVEELYKRLSEYNYFPADYEELKGLVAENNSLMEENKSLTEEVDHLTKALAIAKRKNEKWFEIVLSYAPDDLIIVNQKLWGQQVVLADNIGKLKGDIE